MTLADPYTRAMFDTMPDRVLFAAESDRNALVDWCQAHGFYPSLLDVGTERARRQPPQPPTAPRRRNNRKAAP